MSRVAWIGGRRGDYRIGWSQRRKRGDDRVWGSVRRPGALRWAQPREFGPVERVRPRFAELAPGRGRLEIAHPILPAFARLDFTAVLAHYANTYRPRSMRTNRGEEPVAWDARTQLTESMETFSPSNASTAAWT